MKQLFPFYRFTIHGNSMLPTLHPGQDILCFTWTYLMGNPKKGDLIVITKSTRPMVKRVQKVSNQKVFVVGDNEQESTDSRDFGWVEKTEIIGKVIWYHS